MRLFAALAAGGLAAPLLSGCLNLQHEYDRTARAQCHEQTQAGAIDACLARVTENSLEASARRRNDRDRTD